MERCKMKKVNLAILQARMSSTRLPNKVLKEINGKALLLYECERLLKSEKIDKLIIATSCDKSDDPIIQFSMDNNIEVYRGPLEDVLSRYYECANLYKSLNNIDELNIIRVTGDCPIIDPTVIDEVVEVFENNNYDYISNTLIPSYPDGMDIEICRYDALKIAYEEAVYQSDREHVTLYIKNNKKFSKYNYMSQQDFSNLRFTVDEEVDFELIEHIINGLYKINPTFSFLDVIAYMTKYPNLFFINSAIIRDEGLQKSLKKDGRI